MMTDDYKYLLTEAWLRKELDDAKSVIDQDPDEAYEICLDGFDDLNALDIKKWADAWKEEQVIPVEGNSYEYHFNKGDEDFSPCVNVWYLQPHNDYCPICDKLTNTKTCAMSKTCCKCLVETFCDECVSENEDDEDCDHGWETHHICFNCKDDSPLYSHRDCALCFMSRDGSKNKIDGELVCQVCWDKEQDEIS
jgi:hypothetical protein